jgi:zinc transport system ATP-binding protein
MSENQEHKNPLIKIENISYNYNGSNGDLVLRDVNLNIYQNDFIWIVGPNGGGKTTLIKLILGLIKPKSGEITVFGEKPVKARKRIGYMPQHVQLDLSFPVTVMDIALMGRLDKPVGIGPYSQNDRNAAIKSLRQVNLLQYAKKSLKELSGGQVRRLLIARALACEPELLILDEPTANLDRVVEKDLFDIFKKLNEHLAIVMVSHDPAFVSEFVHNVVCVNQTVAIHPTSVMEREFIGELYGTSMRVVRHDKHHHEDKKTE